MVKNNHFYLILICSFVFCSSSMVLCLQKSRLGQTRSFFRPTQSGRASLSKAYSWKNPSTSFQSRGFLSSSKAYKPALTESLTNGEYWVVKPKKERIEDLAIVLGQKIKGEPTSILTGETLDDTIERIAEEKSINEPNQEGKTPLMIAIEASAKSSKEKQKEVIRKLHKYGAYLYDLPALKLAVKTANLGALEIMQPYYRLKDLYPEFKKTLAEYTEVLKKIRRYEEAPTLKNIYEKHRLLLKDELEILSRPVQPIILRAPVSFEGKEQDFEIHSVTELNRFEEEYSIDPFNQYQYFAR